MFLNNISIVEFVTNEKTQIIESKKSQNEYGTICCLAKQNSQSDWLVIKSENKSAVAFKWANAKIVPCNHDEAVAHSFLPTQEYLTIPIKVNGDFSTEPSRTRISCDEETMLAVASCAEIIASLFENILLSGKDEIGLVSIISALSIDPISSLRGQRVNDLINKDFLKVVSKSVNSYLKQQGKESIAIQPKWLSDEDIKCIIENSNVLIIGNIEEKTMPGITLLLLRIGLKEYAIDNILKVCKKTIMSSKTRLNLLNTIASDTVFGLSNERVQLMQQAKLFESNQGILSFKEISPDTGFSSDFVEKILGNIEDSTKINFVLRKIGFSEKQIAPIMATTTAAKVLSEANYFKKSFSKTVIKKWRSVEKNVAALLETLEETLKVEDVSAQNLGYDIKVWNKDGTEQYYEVKSVNSLGDTISITNNEYSTANEYGERYYLAIAQQNTNNIAVCFICNPIQNINLTKRVVRWEWIANAYDGVVIEGILES